MARNRREPDMENEQTRARRRRLEERPGGRGSAAPGWVRARYTHGLPLLAVLVVALAPLLVVDARASAQPPAKQCVPDARGLRVCGGPLVP